MDDNQTHSNINLRYNNSSEFIPKRVIFFLSVSCAIVAFLILLTSLAVSSPAYRMENGGQKTGRKLYVGKEILPDHIFYPLLNVGDISIIAISDVEKRPWLELETAQRRLESALALHNTSDEYAELVLITISKSHGYLLQAGEGILGQSDVSANELAYFEEVIAQRSVLLAQLALEVTDAQRAKIDLIMEEEELLRVRIEELYFELVI